MTMRLDYISELQPPMDLLFIPQVIYEYEEPWWKDTDRGKLLIHTPEHYDNSTSRII
jgi:hypothetical protein